MPQRVLRLAITVLLLWAMAACAPEGRLFTTSLPTVDGDPLPVSLRDLSGLVVGVEPASLDLDLIDTGVAAADPADPKSFFVGWQGGACASDELLTFWSADTGPALQLAEHEKLGLGCPAVAIIRVLRVTLSSPISPDLIDVQVVGG